MADTTSGGHDGTTVMTSAMLKAFANPLRRRVVNELVRRRYARAADLAAELDVAANTISFHLRVLAEAGLIEPDPEHARDRRDRVWKPVETRSLELGTPEHPIEDVAAGAAFVRLVVDEHAELVRRVVAWSPRFTQGHDDVVRGTFQQRNMHLTRAEFERAMDRVAELFQEIEDGRDKDDPDALFWQIDIVAGDESI